MCEVSEDSNQIIGDILWKFIHRERSIPSMSDDLMRWLLRISVELFFLVREKGNGRRLVRVSVKLV